MMVTPMILPFFIPDYHIIIGDLGIICPTIFFKIDIENIGFFIIIGGDPGIGAYPVTPVRYLIFSLLLNSPYPSPFFQFFYTAC